MSISIVLSIISITFAIISWLIVFLKGNGKDTEQRVIERTEMNCKLDMINSNVVDIKNDVAQATNDIKNLNNRVIKVEESCKSAHHRIDTLEGKQQHETT